MNKFIGLVLVLLSFSAVSFADDLSTLFNKAGMSPECGAKIETAVMKRCNIDSEAAEGKDRMNPCQELQGDVDTNKDANEGKIELGAYAGDADGYWYAVTITDAKSCKFSLTAEQ